MCRVPKDQSHSRSSGAAALEMGLSEFRLHLFASSRQQVHSHTHDLLPEASGSGHLICAMSLGAPGKDLVRMGQLQHHLCTLRAFASTEDAEGFAPLLFIEEPQRKGALQGSQG